MSLTCFVVLVPEAEPLVAAARAQFDDSARRGLGAHITLLYPFLDPALVDAAVLDQAEAAVAMHEQFKFQLKSIGHFPRVTYLKPEPPDPFTALSLRLTRAFPRYPPYRGAFDKIVPHLTLAKGDLSAAARELDPLSRRLSAGESVSAICRAVTLIENSSGRWKPLREFMLEACAD